MYCDDLFDYSVQKHIIDCDVKQQLNKQAKSF